MTSFLQRSHRGFSLVEVTLALGIAAFCLISLLSLLSVGYRSGGQSRQVIDASATASLLLGMQRSAPADVTGSPTGWALPAVPSGSQVLASANPVLIDSEGRTNSADPAFALSYRMQRVAADSSLCRVYLRLSSPARATSASAQSHYEIITSIRVP